MTLPLTYRDHQVHAIFHAIQAGDSGQIIGMGSVGKSNLLRFLQQPDVLRHRLGPLAAQTLVVYVDINKLLKASHWGLLELMLHQMIAQLERQQAPQELIERLAGLHTLACRPESRDLSLRYLDRALAMVCGTEDARLVFLLDEFDSLYYRLPAKSFAALRALRDDYKRRLCYWPALRRPLPPVDQEPAYREPLSELLSDQVVWLGPYADADARQMLENLRQRHAAELSPVAVSEILTTTGGHGGLLRAVFPHLENGRLPAISRLLAQPGVVDECQRLWRSLLAEDQQTLARLAGQPAKGYAGPAQGYARPAPQPELEALRRKGLLGGDWRQPDEIFSPLFEAYLHGCAPQNGRRVEIDAKRHTAVVDSREITSITGLEWDLLLHLAGRRGEVCPRAELYEVLYGEKINVNNPDQRLNKLVERLRKHIEPDPRNPTLITNVHGAGYTLND